jgi:SRSO17 transposase
LPKGWTGDAARPAAAHVPGDTAFATKPALAVQMIRRAIFGRRPVLRVAADAVYGVGDVEQVLRRACKGYVLGSGPVPHTLAHGRASWRGAGTAAQKSPAILAPLRHGNACRPARAQSARLHDWAYRTLADPAADEYDETVKLVCGPVAR